MNFVQFRETNENEGETWNFWLQEDGNADSLNQLVELIEDAGLDDEYEITGESITEDQVDTLVEYGGVGYMRLHNKCKGEFVIPEIDSSADLWEAVSNMLYKGGIEDLFV